MIFSSALLYFLIGVSIARVQTVGVDVTTRPANVAATVKARIDEVNVFTRPANEAATVKARIDEVNVSTRPADVAATEKARIDGVDVSTRPADVAATEKARIDGVDVSTRPANVAATVKARIDEVNVSTKPANEAATVKARIDGVDVSTRPVNEAATEKVRIDGVNVSTRPANEAATEKAQSGTSAKEEGPTKVGSTSEARDEFEEILATLEPANHRNHFDRGNIDDFYVNPEILKGLIGEMEDKVDPIWYIDSMLRDYDEDLREMIEDIVKVSRKDRIQEFEAKKRIIMEDFGIDLDDSDTISKEMNAEDFQKEILGNEDLSHLQY